MSALLHVTRCTDFGPFINHQDNSRIYVRRAERRRLCSGQMFGAPLYFHEQVVE